MKIYTLPTDVPPPFVDYSNYNGAKVAADEKKHMAALKASLIKGGYSGKHTGKIYRESVADGYALYMVADGKSFCLVHLPYGDAYRSVNVQFLPKSEILRRIEAKKRFSALFSK